MKFAFVLVASLLLIECAAQKPAGETANPRPTADSLPTLWMQKPDGSKQCGFAKGVTPDEVLKQLTAKGISVTQARKGNDGLMHAMVCGGATGDTIDIEVPVDESPKLRKLGFKAFKGPQK